MNDFPFWFEKEVPGLPAARKRHRNHSLGLRMSALRRRAISVAGDAAMRPVARGGSLDVDELLVLSAW